MGRREARIGGITFEAVPLDRYQAVVATTWDGIEGGLAIRRDEVPRPGAHGSFGTPGYLSARVLPFAGHLIQRTADATLNMRHRLIGLGDGQTRRLDVDLDGLFVWMNVAVASQPTVAISGSDPRVATFDVQFWAPNPRMYGTERTFAAGEQVFQRGNFPADPVIEVTGPRAAYTISTDTGKSITIGQALATGQKHRIEMRTGRLYRDGVLQTGAITAGGTWTIPPTSPGIVHSISAAGPMSIIVTDTYI
ncbi:conserved hypothetical protein [Microbacterium sp. 8M]|uniref:hypothetical protein n=1 Tax=Microbacterium sp. 8M TaxID=2653153 RepID=UPI0012F17612|nr:hypothetical protein [Microbacterium sp. 8M]VXC30540.1 conserved hypothetical protein [Microbacterium sp. 8M]